MRVAVVTESFLPEVNGVTNTVLRVLEHLQRHGHQALVLASGRGGPTDYAGAPVVRALSVPVPRYRSLSIGLPSPRLEAALRLFQPEVVAAWNRRLAASFDRVVCTTGWAAEEFLRLGAGNVDRVPLGVDLEAFAPDRASARLRRRLAPDTGPLLVHAGRLAREKRPELAVATLKGVLERWPRARLVFAGAGPLRPRLSALAGGLPVEFLGFVADLLGGLPQRAARR